MSGVVVFCGGPGGERRLPGGIRLRGLARAKVLRLRRGALA